MAELLTFLQALGENANQNQLVTHRDMLETLWERADTHAGAIKEIHAFMEYSDALANIQMWINGFLAVFLFIFIGLFLVFVSRQEKRLKRIELAVMGHTGCDDLIFPLTKEGQNLMKMTPLELSRLIRANEKAGREGPITTGEAR